MKKFLSMLSILIISWNSIPFLIISNPYYEENKNISNKIKDLSEFIQFDLDINRNKRNILQKKHQNHQYSKIKTNGLDKPTEQQIKERLKEKNPQLDINKINIIDITTTSATIIPNDISIYSSKKYINFIVDKSVDISTKITITNLGQLIDDKYNILSFELEIKNKLKNKNPNLNINKINIENITTTGATIISNDNSVYTGTININYTLPLSHYIKNKNFGKIKTNNGFDKPTEQQIKNRLKELNSYFSDSNKILNYIKISNITSTSAILNSLPNIAFSGTVNINFIVDKSVDISTKVTITNLGEFETNNFNKPTEQQIKNRLKEKNPQLDINKINIKNINISNTTITSNDSNIYTGVVIINYTISLNSLDW